MFHHSITQSVLFILCLTFYPISLVWAASGAVGFVESFNAKAEWYQLTRAKKPVPVRLGMALQVGDEITVSQPNAWIKLNLAGYQEEVTQKNSPYLVTADKGTVPSVLSNLVAWLGRLMSFHEAETKDTPVASANTRSVSTGHTDGLALFLLSNHSGRLLADQRVLHLAWFGGKPAYTVTITRDKTPVVSTLTTEQPWLQTPEVKWTPGDYQVTIKDANRQSVSHSFTVVTDAIAYPKELQTVQLTPEVRITLQATWLAAHEGGKWSFEAYQQVAGVAEQYYPARLLRNALEVGLEVKGQ